ncbi:mitochondrial ATP synthase delta subunit, putative [Plasmodium knowlesi strain H]|uniref:Mitochondrial ATP synthase delta subunit, putative n=3 Tax=Plasmodium knowlesi TaxID=5850 RepID=A0A5K1UML9_PLAKH|nr:ATP synthase subunit O, mitochondrial, putative [Plasmodium knowlesi strain H]OTN64209.1 putative Mitochondrial ATP synthase delta subunit [Plasmodium knowlesi]CAA9990703.1 ATP synthase subunit O, mitochondrial, putative [Plasmodium knowlesi strain H]SBO25897.1 mitochondrial ATP synthase delta subunit, putative [Plasmodium knowlesi strain H]SBO28655.1 mitochondrial ATP synthase delta subunit, putative [Plasmodium knowlesi strain H]VVS80177.1 ATP synthase subunit O, mitochondrial, putative [|eukprot:XP_002261993.1 mitochondrial ATP synthase delta subunit,putative [Plasmodium knowlesi strain H]
MKGITVARSITHLAIPPRWSCHVEKKNLCLIPCRRRESTTNGLTSWIRPYSSTAEGKKAEDEYYLSMGDNIEKRYSLALYNVGKKNKKINEISSDILFIKNNFLKDKTFLNFLQTPNIENKEKLNFLKTECKKYNNNFSPITSNFLESLFDSKRINFLQKIIEEFELLLMKERKEIKCFVYTAKEINNTEKQKIQESILFKLKNELKPLIEYKIDKSILGGLVLQIGNQVFDFSAKYKIEKIRSNLS